ncbi:MAG: Tat pathway signal sequence domain protein [Caulobacteraceae bacterium]|nr:Tat pathway signal sequence domain protein [Caulobacter sp.]
MRRVTSVLLGVALAGALLPAAAYAQASQREDDARREAQSEADAKKKQKAKEWDTSQAPLPDVKNAGPCPFVKVLYDAARQVELKDGKESPSAVGFTGEIQNVRSVCQYKGAEPIRVQMAVNFQFGRGPQAEGETKTYRYWVAVTKRNSLVLDKQEFAVPVRFTPGVDRMTYTDLLKDVVIPRADKGVSGSNFEVLVGFDVTPQQAEFNRDGKRFRANAGVAQVASQ